MTLTVDQLEKIYGASSTNFALYIPFLEATFTEFEINTKLRKAAFLSQVGVESALFSRTVENLNYSVEGLLKTWPSHFNKYNVSNYARQPEKIANHAYAERGGNGDEASGDGWAFTGRGLIQITGRTNYTALSRAINKSLDDLKTYLITPEGATRSAGWYWHANGINRFADADNIKDVTYHVNGGYNGLNTRTLYYNSAKLVLE